MRSPGKLDTQILIIRTQLETTGQDILVGSLLLLCEIRNSSSIAYAGLDYHYLLLVPLLANLPEKLSDTYQSCRPLVGVGHSTFQRVLGLSRHWLRVVRGRT